MFKGIVTMTNVVNVSLLKVNCDAFYVLKDSMQICLMENVLRALYCKIVRHVSNRINIIKMDGNGILEHFLIIHFKLNL